MSGPNEYEDYFIYTEQERLSQLLEQGVEVEEPEFYFMWNHIFREWFPLSRGWMVLQQRYVEVTPSFTVKVVLDASGASVHDNILSRGVGSKVALVAVVRHALKWTDEGREHVMEELQTAMRAALSGGGVSIVWGIAAIGFHWKAFKQESLAKVDRVTEWRSEVLSPDSWQAMRDL
ncbi:hypothetical protein FRC00_008409, partial [Tulasnella sp. 408]